MLVLGLSGEIKPTKKKRRMREGRKINKDREMDREKYLLEEVSQAVVEVKKSHVCRLENQESK